MVSLVTGARPFFAAHVSAAYMGTRSLTISNSKAGANGVDYDVLFTTVTPSSVGSIEIQFCSNSTIVIDPCQAPVGFDATGAVLTNQTGTNMTGFSISGSSTANDVILTRPAAGAGAVTAEYIFNGVINPSAEGSYYVRVNTFPTIDASGPLTDHGGMAFSINNPFDVAVTVPPYLLFCVGITVSGTDCTTASGDFIDLGNLSAASTSKGQSQMVVATNGKTGFNITANGTTLESGNNTIPAMNVAAPITVGTSQFGINLRSNSNPAVGANPSGPGTGVPSINYNTPNQFHYADGDVVVSKNIPEDLRKYTVSYIVNVGTSQAVGIYASTFTYVATANF